MHRNVSFFYYPSIRITFLAKILAAGSMHPKYHALTEFYDNSLKVWEEVKSYPQVSESNMFTKAYDLLQCMEFTYSLVLIPQKETT